jgi:hypothetical protein
MPTLARFTLAPWAVQEQVEIVPLSVAMPILHVRSKHCCYFGLLISAMAALGVYTLAPWPAQILIGLKLLLQCQRCMLSKSTPGGFDKSDL